MMRKADKDKLNPAEIKEVHDESVDDLYLIFPSMAYEDDILSYRREFIEEGKTMAGTSGLRYADSISEWIRELEEQQAGSVGELVQASTYLCVRKSDNRVVGMINIRHHLNDDLRSFGGHIGYSIRRSERGKGYGKAQLKLGLAVCQKLRLTRILITCNKDNLASAAVIRANGGIFIKDKFHEAELVSHYWILIE